MIKLKKDDLKPGTKMAALPSGIHTGKIKATVHNAKVAKIELTVTKSTNKKAVGKKTWDNIEESVSWKIGQLLASLGLEKKAAKVKTIKDLVKLIDGLIVRFRSVQQTSDEYGTQSKVKQYLPPEASADEDDSDDEEDETDDDDDAETGDDEEEEEEEEEEESDEEESDDEDEDEDEDEEEDDSDEEEDDEEDEDEDEDEDEEEDDEDEDEEEDDDDEDDEEEEAPKSKKSKKPVAKAAPAKSSKKRR